MTIMSEYWRNGVITAVSRLSKALNYLRHLLKSKQSNHINICIVLLRFCEYLEYLISVQTLSLFNYTGYYGFIKLIIKKPRQLMTIMSEYWRNGVITAVSRLSKALNYLRHLLKSKQSNHINICIVLLRFCEYLEYLISVQTLLLFNYTGSALKNTDKWFLANIRSLQKQCLFFKKRHFQQLQLK